jgi:hypothetical protein
MSAAAGWALVAVAVRLAVWWAARDAGVFADMEQYHSRAVALLETGTLPDVLRGPGYPLALAAVYAAGGVSFTGARLFHALVGGGLALAAAWLARLSGAGARAWVAAAVVAIYPGLVLSSVYLMPEGWYALLCALALGLAASTGGAGRAALARAGVAGLTAGAAILTRSVGVAVLPGVAVAVAWAPLLRGRRLAAAGRLGVLAVACGLVLAPWLAFTTRVAGGPLLDATSGMNLLLGNHPGATGRLQLEHTQPLFDAHVAGATSTADGNARATRAGLAWATAHPGAWARLAVIKLGFLFGLEGREHAWVYSVGYFGARAPATVRAWGVALIVAFPLLALGACAGLAAGVAWRTPAGIATALFVLATAVLHAISFGESRFHLPLVPVLAAWAAVAAAPPAQRQRWSPPGVALGALFVVALAWGWSTQLPELGQRLTVLATPEGWKTALPY